jgi:hypothetical protein
MMDEVNAWVLAFRSAAIDFRAFREHNTERSREKQFALCRDLSLLIAEIVRGGYLSDLKALKKHIEATEDRERKIASGEIVGGNLEGFGLSKEYLFYDLLGYTHAVYQECEFEHGDNVERAGLQILSPGLIREVSPIVFKPIEDVNWLGEFKMNELDGPSDEAGNLKEISEEKRFEQLGYYAFGCECVADLLQAEMSHESELAQLSELDALEESLSGQRLKLLRFLRGRKHWTGFETLASEDGIWEKTEPSDSTIAKAIKRLNISLLDSTYNIEVRDRRVKMSCLRADK